MSTDYRRYSIQNQAAAIAAYASRGFSDRNDNPSKKDLSVRSFLRNALWFNLVRNFDNGLANRTGIAISCSSGSFTVTSAPRAVARVVRDVRRRYLLCRLRIHQVG
jgi:hypothetical protein